MLLYDKITRKEKREGIRSKGMEKRKNKKEIGEGIEELLTRLRKEKNWSYVEVVSKLTNKNITEKDIRKWEIGLKYPDLDMIYELSALYEVPSNRLIQAKNNSYEKGSLSINQYAIKWICYLLNVSMHAAMVLMVLFYTFALIFALYFFVTMASQVRK